MSRLKLLRLFYDAVLCFQLDVLKLTLIKMHQLHSARLEPQPSLILLLAFFFFLLSGHSPPLPSPSHPIAHPPLAQPTSPQPPISGSISKKQEKILVRLL